MKFGYISGDNLRNGRAPDIPKVIRYTYGEHAGETHTVTPHTVVINSHGSNLYERNYDTRKFEQKFFKVPENVRIFFYTLPGKLTCTYGNFRTKNICKSNFKNVTLVYEPGDDVPEFLLNVTLPIYENNKKIPPFIFFCETNTGYNVDVYADEELGIPISSTGRISFEYLTNAISNNEPGLFLNIHIIACNSFSDPVAKMELEQSAQSPDIRTIESSLAALSISNNPRIVSDEETEYYAAFRGQMPYIYNDPSLNPFQIDKALKKQRSFDLHFGKMKNNKPVPTNMKLYNRVKNTVKRKVARWPSAYASGQVVKMYRRLGGKYKGKRSSSSLSRWYKERWMDVCTGKPCGRKRSSKKGYPYCRPSRKISSKTPKLISQFSKSELKRRCLKKRKLKYKTMRFGNNVLDDIAYLKSKKV